MGIYEMIGWLGALLFIFAYFFLVLGWLSSERGPYHLMNALGGICLVINAVNLSDMPTLVVNAVWGVIALYALVKILKR